MGIHKGYDPCKNLNFGTMITESLIKTVEQWCFEMNYPFRSINNKENTKTTVFNLQRKQNSNQGSLK